MDKRIENNEIWKQIKGSEKLFEIYTYFPTLHDAEIRKIGINLEKRKFFLIVDYCDFIKEPSDEVLTRISICWLNVKKADFNWCDKHLYGIKFSKENNFIKTIFEVSSGFYGEIFSDEVEITNVQVEPENDGNAQVDVVKFSIN